MMEKKKIFTTRREEGYMSAALKSLENTLSFSMVMCRTDSWTQHTKLFLNGAFNVLRDS